MSERPLIALDVPTGAVCEGDVCWLPTSESNTDVAPTERTDTWDTQSTEDSRD